MKKYPMKTALHEIYSAGLENARFEVEFDGHTIFSSDAVFYELTKYTDYTIGVVDFFTPSTAYFISLWADYRANTKEQLYRAWQALKAQYDPVSNYDMTEQSSDGRKVSKETEKVTPHGGSKTVTSRFGIDSDENGAPYDTTMTTPLESTFNEKTTEFEHNKTVTDNAGNSLSGYHESKDHFLRRSGNIGVTLASDMVLAELSVREIDLLKRYVKEFIDRYCYYVGGENCDNLCIYIDL